MFIKDIDKFQSYNDKREKCNINLSLYKYILPFSKNIMYEVKLLHITIFKTILYIDSKCFEVMFFSPSYIVGVCKKYNIEYDRIENSILKALSCLYYLLPYSKNKNYFMYIERWNNMQNIENISELLKYIEEEYK